MDNINYTTEHRKGQHLLSEERHAIEVRLKDGWSLYRIAKHLGRPYNTIKNEIKRGTVSLYNGKMQRYKSDEGKKVYLEHRRNCRKQYRCLASVRFLKYVVEHFKSEDKWSLDASYGKALESGKFRREEMVCTKTLYNYVDLGLLPIKNIDLPEKLRRNTKAKKARENKKILGRSIEERPEIVSLRTEFGHWEIDTVIGKKDEGEPCVLTLVERMTRISNFLFFKTTKKGYRMKTTTVFAIGRWMPIHLGHKGFLVKLARSFDRLVIGIGSCYENGTPRNCIPAIEREKLLRKMLKTEGITNAIIIPIEDRETFEEWIADVCRVCERYEVTHFCTGNKKDILDVLESKDITLDVEMINPEEGSDFPYHATDIRNAILAGETERLDSMIPAEIKPMVLEQISREILRASRGEGQAFVPGRQTVDLILAVKNRNDQKNYVLIGKRNMEKIDFPGAWAIPGEAIREFESPIDAAIRCFYNETGLKIVLNDNACEPAMITLQSLDNLPCELHFTGIYASRDERINGTRGGGSQCFAIYVEDDIDRITPYLHPIRDMVELKFVDVDEIHKITLAYDQKHMILDTFVHLGIPYDNGEMLARFSEDGQSLPESVSRKEAHSIGALHGASHVFIYKRANGKLWFLLQRRSLCKDSFPGCLDMSSGGHVEAGYDFLSTALKEISEELSITVSAGELQVLFSQFISYETVFHGKPFIDREINVVYALEKDLDPPKLALQAQEVAKMVWLEAEVILSRIDQKDPEICMDPEEFKKVINALT